MPISSTISRHITSYSKAFWRSKEFLQAKPVFGDAIDQLKRLIANLRDETLFLYIDPYGLNCEFDVLRPLLERDKRFSISEILINLHQCPLVIAWEAVVRLKGDGTTRPANRTVITTNSYARIRW